METRGRRLSKKEQDKIVNKINTGAISDGVGFSIGKVIIKKR